MKNIFSISLVWGGIATLIAVVIDVILKFSNAHLYSIGRYGLYFLTISILGICIYLAIKKYRDIRFKNKSFLLFQGFSVGALTSLVYALFFSMYLFILSQTLLPDMFEKYKKQQIIAIENSSISEAEKQIQMVSINDMTNGSILIGDFIQRLIFPLTLSLFIAIFMQRKKSIEHIEKQQNF